MPGVWYKYIVHFSCNSLFHDWLWAAISIVVPIVFVLRVENRGSVTWHGAAREVVEPSQAWRTILHRPNATEKGVCVDKAKDAVWKYGQGQGFLSQACCVSYESERTCWSHQPIWRPAFLLPGLHSYTGKSSLIFADLELSRLFCVAYFMHNDVRYPNENVG